MSPSHMDSVRAAILSAMSEGMSITQLWLCAEHARTAENFDRAVNELAQTMPPETTGQG